MFYVSSQLEWVSCDALPSSDPFQGRHTLDTSRQCLVLSAVMDHCVLVHRLSFSASGSPLCFVFTFPGWCILVKQRSKWVRLIFKIKSKLVCSDGGLFFSLRGNYTKLLFRPSKRWWVWLLKPLLLWGFWMRNLQARRSCWILALTLSLCRLV